MKLRTDGQSLRLRIGRSEIQQLQKNGRISTKLPLPGEQALSYSLDASEELTEAQITFDGGRIGIHLPKGETQKWMDDDNLEGLYYSLHLPKGRVLSLAIEKDYPCQHKAADNKDTFNRPSKKK